jgi:hypothetical protein
MSEDVTIRAARAQQLLEDEVLTEAMSGVVKRGCCLYSGS